MNQPQDEPGGPPQGGVGRVAETNGLAIASLVLGIVWLMGLGSILALIFGYVAKSQIDRSGGWQTGRGLAIAGIVLGWVGVGLVAAMIALMAAGFSMMPGWDGMMSGSDGMMGEH